MKSQDFVQKWERQRKQGRIRYALIHGAVFAIAILLIGLAFKLAGQPQPENLSMQTALYFGLGGSAYGLIRFNIRERFYTAIKSQMNNQN